MALTRPRASQIYNIDYKQATRVVTITNITLSGGAPSQVDGVNLSLNDRILVTGQSTGSQNGLYYVSTLGSGSNGTWTRSSDNNATGELLAGIIVMVTEGLVYADTQWKLTTDDPIIIGTTALTFVQNYSANSISAGTSNVSVISNANVNISSNGTANVVAVSNTGAYVIGVVSATGNITGSYILGNGSQLTGLPDGYGNANLANIGSNTISTTGNVSSGNFLTTGLVSATGNVYGNNFVTSGSGGSLSGTGNITGGNILTAGQVSATGNITGSYIIGNGSQLTGLPAGYANSDVANYLASGTDTSNIITTGNIQGTYILGNGALLTGVITSVSNINNGTSNVSITSSGANVTVGVGGTSNVAVFATTGEYVTGLISATGNIYAGGVRTTTASTPPSTPSVGDVWYNTTNTVLYRYSYDGGSYYWQDLSGGGVNVNGGYGNLVVGTLTTPVYCALAAVNTLYVLNTSGSNVAVYTS